MGGRQNLFAEPTTQYTLYPLSETIKRRVTKNLVSKRVLSFKLFNVAYKYSDAFELGSTDFAISNPIFQRLPRFVPLFQNFGWTSWFLPDLIWICLYNLKSGFSATEQHQPFHKKLLYIRRYTPYWLDIGFTWNKSVINANKFRQVALE
jgi:hypothetical protein